MATSKNSETGETQTTQREASTTKPAQGGCCGGAAPQGVDACCALDAEVKSSGGAGCGCAPKTAAAPTVRTGCC